MLIPAGFIVLIHKQLDFCSKELLSASESASVAARLCFCPSLFVSLFFIAVSVAVMNRVPLSLSATTCLWSFSSLSVSLLPFTTKLLFTQQPHSKAFFSEIQISGLFLSLMSPDSSLWNQPPLKVACSLYSPYISEYTLVYGEWAVSWRETETAVLHYAGRGRCLEITLNLHLHVCLWGIFTDVFIYILHVNTQLMCVEMPSKH